MKRVVLISVLLASAALAAEVWTNRSGRAFSAKLLSVSDSGAVFVFDEDGATNVLSFAKLSPESARRACDRFGFAPLPPRIAATYKRALADLKRIGDLKEDGLLSPEKAKERIDAVCKAFTGICRKKGLEGASCTRLETRLRVDFTVSRSVK